MSGGSYGVRDELRRRIAAQLRPVMPDAEARSCADLVMTLFYSVDEDWDRVDVTAMQDLPGASFLDQRWIVAKVPVQVVRYDRPVDRTVEANG